MELGISSFTYGWNVGVAGSMPEKAMDETDLVRQTLDFGLACLQIGDNLPIHTFDEDRKNNFRSLIKQNGIRLEIGAKNLSPENLEQYIDLCAFFDSPLLRFVIDDDDYQPNTYNIIALIKDILPELVEKNIVLGIENHDRFEAQQLAYIMNAVGHRNVGICLDCVNSIGAGEGLAYVASILAPYTVNLHIKDFKISRLPHKMGFTVQGEICGKGMTDLPWLLETVKRGGSCKSAVLEQWVPPEVPLGVPPGDNIAETCRKEREWAEQGVAYIKSLMQ
ncbi:sugar phosphate isomerase/epimerase family protein [Dyadobacter fanqingshengii]|uniref:Sugar phosphate isomerase/epimerase n=1 Tax=Dyadobacter fanqingshengii TaxID=2906443 RepID=A0A9X1PBP8_9BACT|nr:TIM barrel protein [Dyadobacter fanqingshengii]MCF0040575.1 sugar phosphate isomerase/epimerase [Dyadobacter fanqingshengii]USJ37687.1 sugar phosphate isomerase/epimerase [Dyadobacter fanqingshengii]